MSNFNLTEFELKNKLRELYNELLKWHMRDCSYCKLTGEKSKHIENLDEIFRGRGWLS